MVCKRVYSDRQPALSSLLLIFVLLLLASVSCSEDKQSQGTNVIPKEIEVVPRCPVLATGQTKSYAEGDDGTWQTGHNLPDEERFEDTTTAHSRIN